MGSSSSILLLHFGPVGEATPDETEIPVVGLFRVACLTGRHQHQNLLLALNQSQEWPPFLVSGVCWYFFALGETP